MKKQDVRTVIKENEEPQPIEVLESAIVQIAKGFAKLQSSRLKDETIARLVAWQSNVSIVEVRKVLDCLADLEDLLLKPKAKK